MPGATSPAPVNSWSSREACSKTIVPRRRRRWCARSTNGSPSTASADDEVFFFQIAFGEACQPPAVEDFVLGAARQPVGVELAHHRRHHEAVPHETAAQIEAGNGFAD